MGHFQAIHGSILGTVVGDAIGLPYEALSKSRGIRLLGEPTRHRFVFGKGMMSDDGEHTCMVAQSLCASGLDVERFQRELAMRLRWWLLGLPAGIGGATLRAAIRLWLGFSPARSGVFSAGNGPAMRSAVLGAAIDDPIVLRQFVEASSRLTHTDPKATHGALAIAWASRCARLDLDANAYLSSLDALPVDELELTGLLKQAVQSASCGEPTAVFAESIGATRGVSGYVYQTVPVAIHAWLRHPLDYRQAVMEVIACGGDTDSVAAIVGGIIGSKVGIDGIPSEWRDDLMEWPRSRSWIECLSVCLTSVVESQKSQKPPAIGPGVLVRNLFFIVVVIAHVVRRAFPPY